MFKPGDNYSRWFSVSNIDGSPLNADATANNPSGVFNKNGIDDITVKTYVTSLSTGRYVLSGVIPIGYAKGDDVNTGVFVTVSGVKTYSNLDRFELDSLRVGDLNNFNAGTTPVSVSGTVVLSGTQNFNNIGQTSKDIYSVLNPMISGGAYLASALVNAPAGSGGSFSGVSLGQIQTELDTRGLTAPFTSGVNAKLDVTVSSRLAATGLIAGLPTSGINSATFAAGTTIPHVSFVDNAVTASGGTITNTLQVSGMTPPVGFSTLVITSGTLNINMGQIIQNPNATGTLGFALAAAEVQGGGRWSLTGTVLSLYRADKTTLWGTLNLDSTTSPTSRS